MFDELRHLLLVVEHGTFTAAARRAHLSQPALSASIRRLETAFGARMLYRGRSGAELTPAGAALVPRARAALAALEDGRRAVLELEGLEAGEVRVAAGGTVATYRLPPLVAAYRRRHPGVRILLRELQPAEAREALAHGEVDLAIVDGEEGEPWQSDEFVIVGAPGVGWPTPLPFIAFARGTATREALHSIIPDAPVAMELGSIAAVKGHVAQGIGIALLSRSAVERDLAAGRLVEVHHPRTPIPRPLSLLHRGVDRLPPAARALRDLLLDAQKARPRTRVSGRLRTTAPATTRPASRRRARNGR